MKLEFKVKTFWAQKIMFFPVSWSWGQEKEVDLNWTPNLAMVFVLSGVFLWGSKIIIFVHTRECVCTRVQEYKPVCEGQRLTALHQCFWHRGLSLALGLAIWLSWLGSKPQRLSSLWHPSARITDMHHHFTWVLGLQPQVFVHTQQHFTKAGHLPVCFCFVSFLREWFPLP